MLVNQEIKNEIKYAGKEMPVQDDVIIDTSINILIKKMIQNILPETWVQIDQERYNHH